MKFRAKDIEFDLNQRVLLMGILNVTPDSFSEQGENFEQETAVAAAIRMVEEGAEIIDIGGESTRPGAEPVTAKDELSRVIPVIKAVREQSDAVISIDTWKADVAHEAVVAGARIINDISGGRRDPDMAAVAAETGAGYVAMHMRGNPQTMQQFTDYEDLIGEINRYFDETLKMLGAAGVDRDCVALDPGIGFSKTVEQNLILINRLSEFAELGRPVLLGPSRKSFIGKTLNIDDPGQRVWGTAAAIAVGIGNGARILRVHDIPEMRQVCDLASAIKFSKSVS